MVKLKNNLISIAYIKIASAAVFCGPPYHRDIGSDHLLNSNQSGAVISRHLLQLHRLEAGDHPVQFWIPLLDGSNMNQV